MAACASIDGAALSRLVPSMSLEWLLTSTLAFGLTTASPLQRALCRVAEGFPLEELADAPGVAEAFGGVLPPAVAPAELGLIAAIRSAKSLFAAALAVNASQKCDVSRLGPGEIPRVSVVSLRMDLADVVFDHLQGRTQASPALAPLLLSEPVKGSLFLRHPTGRPVQIKVVAGARAGASLVSRWSAGCIFDEFPRMIGGADGVINWDDSRDAVLLRMLPGAQLVHLGSPWAPYGPAYDMVMNAFGRPSKQLVVCKAPGWVMNPVHWTPERCAAAKLADPDVYNTDVAAEFGTAEEALYSVPLIDKAIRPECSREPGATYVAAMDPGTRGNAWTFGLFTRTGKRKRMVLAREWIGSRAEPLSPRAVMKDIAIECKKYEVTTVESDQYSIDAIADIAKDFGLRVAATPITEHEKVERYLGIRAKLAEDEIEIVQEVKQDLVRLKRVITQAGVRVHLPLTSDGRHCDYAPVVMLGLGRYIRDTEPSQPQRESEEARMLRVAQGKYAPNTRKPSWKR